MIEELRDKAKNLLKDKKVDIIIGYEKGTLPLQSSPIFVEDEKGIENLIFDYTCANNLAKYLTKDDGFWVKNKKVGIIAKGCDGRAIVNLIKENKIKREDIIIIGVPCHGVIERSKLPADEIINYEIKDNKVKINEKEYELERILCDCCLSCKYPNTPIYDIFIGEKVKPKEKDEFEFLKEIENLSSDERWEYFKNELSKCIRCYACRNTCPLCYCKECFVDRTNPLWFGKSIDVSDTMLFHIGRAIDLAGRCVDCGDCVRSCPMNINLRVINKKLEKEVKERFNYIPGIDEKEKPPLATFNETDAQEFIM